MELDKQIQLLSLTFLWAFGAVFCIAVYLSYRRTRYAYLQLATIALIFDLVKQLCNDLTLSYPWAILFAASSVCFFFESIFSLAAVSSANDRPLGRRAIGILFAAYLTSLVFIYAFFDERTRWSWYLSYSPALACQLLLTWHAWQMFRERYRASGWLLGAAISVLSLRLALPWMSPQPDLIYGFTYFVDGILFALMMGTLMLVALEQLTAEKTRSLLQREEAESTIRFLLDNTEDVIVSHDVDGVMQSWNSRAESMFGYDASEAIGKLNVDQLLVPFDEHRARTETSALRKDGGQLPVEVSRRHAINDDHVYYTLVIRDLSQARRVAARQDALSAQLQELQKVESLGVLAAGVAHDFNNLLASMMGHAELAAKQLATPQQARQNLEQVITAALRASELTEQMLTYAGKTDFNPVRIDLNATIREIVSLMSASVNPRAEFELDLAEDGAFIPADPSQMTQVLINLVTNASDALDDRPGTIHISTRRRLVDEVEFESCPLGQSLPSGDYLVMKVGDTGNGMPEDVRRRVFEPFFSTKFTGRGLGLAAVAGIVKKHGAAVKVDSAPGRWTEFTFYFPTHGAAAPASPKPVAGHAPEAVGLRALIVDDQPDLVGLCASILTSAGHHSEYANDGEQALLRVQEQPAFDLLILDCNLPGRSGPDIYTDLRARGYNIPVIFISGYDLARIQARINADWNAVTLKKPFMADDLLECVDAVYRSRNIKLSAGT